MTTVLMADDSALLREGLVGLLERQGYEIVGQEHRADALLATVAELAGRDALPDVVITDVRMPPTMTNDGLRAAIRIKEDHPRVAVLVLSQYVSPLHAQELFALPAPPGAGGAGYLLKDRVAQVADFIGALRMVVGGQIILQKLDGCRYNVFEQRPVLGFRGAARYVADSFKDCFALECKALKRVRDEMGLTNVEIMIPFVRTLGEAEAVVKALKENGLERGKNGLRLIMMCELPSNAVLAEQFLQYFDGFSIGSNDMTQLTLGLDRDSGLVSDSFDERNPAVKVMLHLAISACRKQNKYIGICGQGPSDHPDFAKWLVEEGIESVSLNPDTVIKTWLYLANELNK